MLKPYIESILLFFALFLVSTAVDAHEVRPALIEVNEIQVGVYDVMFKMPALGNKVVKLKPLFPVGFEPLGPVNTQFVPGAFIQRFTLKSNTGERLFGKEINFEGLSSLQIAQAHTGVIPAVRDWYPGSGGGVT